MQNSDLEILIQQLENADINQAGQIAKQISCCTDENTVFSDNQLKTIGKLLKSDNNTQTYHAAYMLVGIAEGGVDISTTIPYIVDALWNADIKTKKELVWALYCMASQNIDISNAVEPMMDCLENNESLKANGSIALTLHFLNKTDLEHTSEMFTTNDVYIQFGAIWASVEYYNKYKNDDALREIFDSVPFGISNPQIRQAISGYFDRAKQKKHNIDFSVQLIRKMIQENKHDPVKQAPLISLLLKI